MKRNVVAIYDDIGRARQVIEDLVEAGFLRNSIALITNDATNPYNHYLDKGYTARSDAVTSVEGAVVGLLIGILVGVIASVLPGIGLTISAGPIVGAITGAVVGLLIGGLIGKKFKSSVAEDEAPYYAEGIHRGATLLRVHTALSLQAEDIMHRQGSINIHERVNVWRQEGWQGFPGTIQSLEDVAKVEFSQPNNAASMQSIPVVKEEIRAEGKPVLPQTDPVNALPVVIAVEPEVVTLKKEPTSIYNSPSAS